MDQIEERLAEEIRKARAQSELTINTKACINQGLVEHSDPPVSTFTWQFREAPEGFKTPAGTLGPLLGLKSPGADHQILEPRKNDVIPLRSKTNPLLFGPADAAATEEPAPPSLSGHDYSLDFRNIRATRACNTVKVTTTIHHPDQNATPVLSHRPPPTTRTHHKPPPRSWSTARAQCQRDTGSATSTTISPHDSESATMDPPPRPPVHDPQTAIHGAATEALDLRAAGTTGRRLEEIKRAMAKRAGTWPLKMPHGTCN
ncbi:unnamed protein product [Pleuronectes platessa]|uniref:Uncharacterized protein n=1 Tax=Pleuronectes platessa TaxID=8262 RepID=A0A9N7V0D5_PLEPL|nr:unnamed protein product [Pleuronectes platessa]